MASGEKSRRKLEREISADDSGITIHFAANYHIAWSRMRSRSDVISWIYHLSEKGWMTPIRLRRFLELVAEKKNLDLHCAP